jgi:hypothetical protein
MVGAKSKEEGRPDARLQQRGIRRAACRSDALSAMRTGDCGMRQAGGLVRELVSWL